MKDKYTIILADEDEALLAKMKDAFLAFPLKLDLFYQFFDKFIYICT